MKALPLSSALCALLAACAAQASESAAQAQAEPACIEVEVNGERVPAYDCLTRKLSTAADKPRQDPRLQSEQIATRPSNEIALFNRAATSQRMGNTFGRSVHPQRPPAPIPVSPVVKKP